MNYTLWRGNVELGRIRIDFSEGDPEKVAGMLELNSSDTEIQSVSQTRFDFGEMKPVFEHVMPDIDAAQSSGVHHGSGYDRAGGRRMSPEEALGIPADRVLFLRDENGVVIDADAIMVTRLPESFMRSKSWIARCAEAGVTMSPWSVAAFRRERR